LKSSWINIALIELSVVAGAGTLLRYFPLGEIGFLPYNHLLHAHSHLAFLGWVYSALFIFFIHFFLDKKQAQKPVYKWLFWLNQVMIAGMFSSFLIQGYKAVSITFLSLQTFISYGFIFCFLRDLKNDWSFPVLFARMALVCLFVSSFGPMFIPIAKVVLHNPDYEKMAVDFYLHFQYNGWFFFGVIAVLLRILKTANEQFRLWPGTFGLLALSVFPAFMLSIQWMEMPDWLMMLGRSAGIAQWAGVVLLLAALAPGIFKVRSQYSLLSLGLMIFGLLFLLLKTTFFAAAVFESIFNIVYQNRPLIIAYFHLVFLGFTSVFLIFFFLKMEALQAGKILVPVGIMFLLAGFVAQEIWLFRSGFTTHFDWPLITHLNEKLFLSALAMLTGVLLLLLSRFLPLVRKVEK